VAAYTLKGFRVFKVREQLADEGKNHAVLILVEAAVFRHWMIETCQTSKALLVT
jgi:hypothetical protein